MQLKKITFFLLLFTVSHTITLGNTNTENDPDKILKPDNKLVYIDSSSVIDTSQIIDDESYDDIFSEKLDSLVTDWYVRNAYNIDSTVNTLYSEQDTSFFDITDNIEIKTPDLPDSVYLQRLEALNSAVDLSFNPLVKNMINFYTHKVRNKVEIMLGLANYYFPIIEETFDKYQLPIELKYMAIIESALNAKAFSRAGASGLWQFMYGTGKNYGLEVNSYVDERRDPVKSTEAAARYLADLYSIYKDWHLVIAAYNCGPGNINRAIARSGGKRDYWSVYYRLPRETRGYVPAFISAAYVMNYYRHHNLSPSEPSFNIVTDTVMLTDYLNFMQISKQLPIDIETLRDLNPMYRRDIIPARADHSYPLVLPVDMISQFIDKQDDIFAYKREEYFPNNKIKNPVNSSNHQSYSEPNTKGKVKVYYTVKSGDVIGLIAEWFNVRINDLRYWNNIHGNIIRYGQKLTIYVPKNQEDYYKDFNSMSYNEKQHAIGKTTTPQNLVKEISADPDFVYYTVRSGDNLWDIAKQYPGISAEDIKSLNNITNTRGLYPGQKLKIMKKS